MTTTEHQALVDSLPDFIWSVGEEGSDPVVMSEGRPYRHDQFAQSGHYDEVDNDLAAIAGLGVRLVRYGMPWRLAEPSPGEYDWTLWDRALGACERHGLEPIVDLLHFGLPDHAGALADPAWIDAFAAYVDAFITRYPTPRLVTPVNEPGILALCSARYGAWNDRLSSEPDHARVLANVVLANLEAIARFRADRPTAWIGAEGFSVPVGGDEMAVQRRRDRSWLVWDLHLRRTPIGAAAAMLEHVEDRVLERILGLAIGDGLIAGLDVYPVSIPAGTESADGSSPDERSIRDMVDSAMDEIGRWHDRYPVPFWIGETSNLSLPVERQIEWLDGMVAGLRELATAGRPVRGLCWYSRGDQYDWQTMLLEPTGAVTEVGLFDADRRPRPVAERFAEYVRG